MARLLKEFYNNIEFFKNNDDDDNDDTEENDNDKNEEIDEDDTDRKVRKKNNFKKQALNEVLAENVKNPDFDEIDDEYEEGEDTLDETTKEVNDLFEDDEEDDEELDDDAIENLIKKTLGDNEDDDEKDDEEYKIPVITKRFVSNPENDEKLTDLDIEDDNNEDNLFMQGGTSGAKALDMISQVQRDGDELADLLLEVPMAIITLTMEVFLKILGAVLERPINKVDSYLQPIRDALNEFYKVMLTFVKLFNNIIGLIVAFIQFSWSVSCNTMRSVGIPANCNTNFKQNNMILDFYESLANINIFKFRDLFFSEEFRQKLYDSIKNLFMILKDAVILCLKVINVLTKAIESIFNGIKSLVKMIEDVTSKDNLQGFMMISVFVFIMYLTIFGLKILSPLTEIILSKF
jgi:hypothetical protein